MGSIIPANGLTGEYSLFEIRNTLTGDVRTLYGVSNALTKQGLAAFANPDDVYHRFDYCFITSDEVTVDSPDIWGQLIPSNSNPDASECQRWKASKPTEVFHSNIRKYDEAEEYYYLATKSWTFPQGIEGVFTTVASGFLLETQDTPTPEDSIDAFTTHEDPLTGEVGNFHNWRLHLNSIALITVNGEPTELILEPVDELTVTHTLRIDLPKYQDPFFLNSIYLAEGKLHDFTIRPYIKGYDSFDFDEGEALTRIYRTDAKEITNGLVPNLKQLISDGSFDTPGNPLFDVAENYDSVEQLTDYDGNLIPRFKNTLVLKENDGAGEISYMVIMGCYAWYEVQISPPIQKSRVDKLTLNFYFDVGG